MAVEDIQAEVLGWAMDEVDRLCLGESFGVAVGFAFMQVGLQPVPVWQLVITGRNPLLGAGPLYHAVMLGEGPQTAGLFARPVEENVRAGVVEGLRLLRALAKAKLSGANGQPA